MSARRSRSVPYLVEEEHEPGVALSPGRSKSDGATYSLGRTSVASLVFLASLELRKKSICVAWMRHQWCTTPPRSRCVATCSTSAEMNRQALCTGLLDLVWREICEWCIWTGGERETREDKGGSEPICTVYLTKCPFSLSLVASQFWKKKRKLEKKIYNRFSHESQNIMDGGDSGTYKPTFIFFLFLFWFAKSEANTGGNGSDAN